jgi:hypothetical protein
LIAAAAVALVLVYVLPSVLLTVGMLSYRSVVTEIQRVESPDQLLDSVVMQTQPGFSIESDDYRVYITLAGSHRFGDPVLELEGAKNLKVTWLAPKLLQLSYTDGCVDTFHNDWSSMKTQNGLDKVEVRLKPPDDATPHHCD